MGESNIELSFTDEDEERFTVKDVANGAIIDLSVVTPDDSHQHIQFYTEDAKTFVHMIRMVAQGQGVEI